MGKGELITLIGETDGTNTSGVCPLRSELVEASKGLVLPLGLKAKIWALRAYADTDTTFAIEYCEDIEGGSGCKPMLKFGVTAKDFKHVELESRPIVIRGVTGKDGFRVTWSQGSAGYANIQLDVEVTDDGRD